MTTFATMAYIIAVNVNNHCYPRNGPTLWLTGDRRQFYPRTGGPCECTWPTPATVIKTLHSPCAKEGS